MRGRPHHAKPTMTRAQNRLAFKMWLSGCTDRALLEANPESLGRSYGLSVQDVATDIRVQKITRKLSL